MNLISVLGLATISSRDAHFYPAVQVVQAGFFLEYPFVPIR